MTKSGRAMATEEVSRWRRAVSRAYDEHVASLRSGADREGEGKVYTDQNVVGLSDADPDAPLTVAFVPFCANGGEGTMSTCTTFTAGPDRTFLIQSGFKPLVFAMALEKLSEYDKAELEERVGDEPDVGYATFPAARSDCASTTCNDTHRDKDDEESMAKEKNRREKAWRSSKAPNPLINSGALIVLELLSRKFTVEEVGEWCRNRTCSSGNDNAAERESNVDRPLFDPAAVEATLADSDRNRAICAALSGSTGASGSKPDVDIDPAHEAAVKYYASLDCLQVTGLDLATVAARLSCPNDPVANETRRVMLQCGMYEDSSKWSAEFRKSLPAKSGVSGVVWATIEGVGGMCAQQPRIDGRGNGVEAMEYLRSVARHVEEMKCC